MAPSRDSRRELPPSRIARRRGRQRRSAAPSRPGVQRVDPFQARSGPDHLPAEMLSPSWCNRVCVAEMMALVRSLPPPVISV